MEKKEAIEELRQNLNVKFCHAVLFCTAEGEYYTDLHTGHPGSCYCDWNFNFVWREESEYTDPTELDHILQHYLAQT